MKNLLLTTAFSLVLAAPAFAVGAHSGGHGHDDAKGHDADHAAMMMVGQPGAAADVDRTINVTMTETEDGSMVFEPTEFDIQPGETIRFVIENKGELEHEFVLDTMDRNVEHKAMMAQMDMEHDDPNSIRLDPGASGEVIWTFSNEGAFEFACLIPGHYESGMHGPITVGDGTAQAANATDTAPAADLEYSSGTVKKIDAKSGKVTVIHGPLVNLDMPSMTMVFRADETVLAKLSEGRDIEFVADRVKGKLTITAVR